MNLSRSRLAPLPVLLAALLVGCNRADQSAPAASSSAAATEVTVHLGFAGPLTGPQAHYGKGYQNGVQMALDDVNATHPKIGGQSVHFDLLAEDDMADPRTATQVAQKLVDGKIAGMIGHFNSGTTIPASKIYAAAEIPEIAMATAPAYTQQGLKSAFRSMTSDTQQGAVMGGFVVKTLKATRIAIIDDRSAYGQGLADEFEKSAKAAGGQIIKREYTTDKATDFTSILTSIKSTKPDAIFYGGADAQSGLLVQQKNRLGISAPLVSGEMTRSDTFLKLAGPDAEGTIASLAGVPLEKMPGGTDFEARFKAKYGEMEIYSPYGYDATRVMIAAMQKADSTDPKKYLPVLQSIAYAGVTTPNWAYDEQGNLKDGGITVYKVVKGKWEVLETIGGKQ